MKKYSPFFVFLILFFSNCYSRPFSYGRQQKINQISIPKSGTYMLASLIHKLTNRKHFFISDKNDNNDFALFKPPLEHVAKQLAWIDYKKFWANHLFFDQDYSDFFKKNEVKTVFLYRDPRDQVISLAFYMTSSDLAKADWPEAQKLSFDELVLDIITKGTTFNKFPPITGGVAALYNLYQPWLTDHNVLAVRFEDLVGPPGGGSEALQFEAIKKLASHLDLRFNDRMIRFLVRKVYGNTGYGGVGTFREGKIGSWKKHFTQQHVDAFKAVAGDLLIQWGYENDYNWGLEQ